MRKKSFIISVLIITVLTTSGYFANKVDVLIRLRLKQMAQEEFLLPIKIKIRKFLRRSRERHYKRRNKKIENLKA